jgi:hypothetical protein
LTTTIVEVLYDDVYSLVDFIGASKTWLQSLSVLPVDKKMRN